MNLLKNYEKLLNFSPIELIWIFGCGVLLLYWNDCAAFGLIVYILGGVALALIIQKYNKRYMKPILHIELDGLVEYRDELTDIIDQFKSINENFDKNLKKLESLGYEKDTISKILNILFKHE